MNKFGTVEEAYSTAAVDPAANAVLHLQSKPLCNCSEVSQKLAEARLSCRHGSP